MLNVNSFNSTKCVLNSPYLHKIHKHCFPISIMCVFNYDPLHLFKLWAVGWWITWFISRWEENDCCQKWANPQNWQLFSLKMVKSCHLEWKFAHLWHHLFSSQLDIKSHDSWANISKLEQMEWTYIHVNAQDFVSFCIKFKNPNSRHNTCQINKNTWTEPF